MNATLAAAIIFVVFAVGDMISAKTKAIVSMLLVASVVFLLGFWAGIFPDHDVRRFHPAEHGGPAGHAAARSPRHDHQTP